MFKWRAPYLASYLTIAGAWHCANLVCPKTLFWNVPCLTPCFTVHETLVPHTLLVIWICVQLKCPILCLVLNLCLTEVCYTLPIFWHCVQLKCPNNYILILCHMEVSHVQPLVWCSVPYLDCCLTLSLPFGRSNIPHPHGWCPVPQAYLNKIIWGSIINLCQLNGFPEINNCVFSYHSLAEQ